MKFGVACTLPNNGILIYLLGVKENTRALEHLAPLSRIL